MADRCVDNCIEWICGHKEAYVTLSYNNGRSALATRIRKEAAAGNPEVTILADGDENEGALYAKIPIKWVKLSPPKQMTEEQKVKAGERMKNLKK